MSRNDNEHAYLMGTGMELEGALQKELSILRERLDAANLERERLGCALHMAEIEASKLHEAFSVSKEHMRRVQDELSTRLDEIHELRSELAETRNELETHRKRINGSEQAAHTKATIVQRELDVTRSRALKEREQFDHVISELRARIAGLDAEVNELSAHLNQLVRSTSWKLTGPLRIVGRRLPVLAQSGRRFIVRLSQLFYAITGRTEPTISRTPFKDHYHGQVASLNASAQAKGFPLDALARFVKLQSRPGRAIGLVAAEFPPMFDKNSAEMRLYNLIRIFCEMDRHVVFVSRCTRDQFIAIAGSPNDRKRYEDHLSKVGIDHIAYGEAAKDLLRTVGGDLRWAYLSSPTVGEELIPMVRLHAPWANIIYDMIGFHPLWMDREADPTQDLQSPVCAEQTQLIELTNAKIADLTIATSEQQRRELLQLDRELVIEVIPNILQSSSDVPLDVSGRSGLLFLGSSWNASSVDGVLWFVNEVWPLIHSKRSDLVFQIIGNNPPPPIRALRAQPGIEVLDNVPNLIDLFTYSRMSVFPLRCGADFHGRVGESLAHGVPVVATSLASVRMPIVHDKHLLIADTPTDFANQVLRLAGNDDLWRRLQSNGLCFIQRQADVVRERLGVLING